MAPVGPRPLPIIRVRNRGTPAQLEDARAATKVGWKALLELAIVSLVLFGVTFLILDVLG